LILYRKTVDAGAKPTGFDIDGNAELKRLLEKGEKEQVLVTFLQDVVGASTAEQVHHSGPARAGWERLRRSYSEGSLLLT